VIEHIGDISFSIRLTPAVFFLHVLVVTVLGGPRPAFYDALFPTVSDAGDFSPFVVEGGWRKVPADGVNPLPVDVYAVQTRYMVAPGKETAFERAFAERESRTVKDRPAGYLFFHLQRRDALKADDGYNFVSTMFWKNKASFDAWRAQQGATAPPGSAEVVGRPSVAMYEGKLALASPRGA
jgi:heme-degrading monooxygenase HmoA